MKSDRKLYGSVKNGKYIREKAAEDPADTNIPSDKSIERQPDKGSDKPTDKSSDKLSDKQSGNRSAEGDPPQHARDVNSRRIFKNAKLTCQFLKEYSGLEIFAELQPEDIEDVTSKYQAYPGVEFESDVIKKIRIRTGEEEKEIFVIPLIEHKSQVDYNVQMQLLRYMSVIWYDYGKKMNKGAEKYRPTSRKSFRYPPIIPIVYYEGKENWTADTELWKRIEYGEVLKEFIPAFSYKVIRIHDYTNEELQKHTDEMSLVMMINKIQSPEDYTEFIQKSEVYMNDVLKDSPQELIEILRDVFWSLLMKINVPQEEAEELMEQMGAKNMGYLFENIKKMDIQAERRNTQKAQERAERAEAEAEEAKAKVKKAKAEAEEAKTEAEEAKKTVRTMIKNLVDLCKQEDLQKEETKERLKRFYKVSEKDLAANFEEIWNNK